MNTETQTQTTHTPGPLEQYVLDHEAPLAWDDPEAVIRFFRDADSIRADLLAALEAIIEAARQTEREMRHEPGFAQRFEAVRAAEAAIAKAADAGAP